MSLHLDPEGIESVLTDSSALSLTIPGGQNVHLYASFDGGWEQAVVVFVNGIRYENQLGSYILRASSLVIPGQTSNMN